MTAFHRQRFMARPDYSWAWNPKRCPNKSASGLVGGLCRCDACLAGREADTDETPVPDNLIRPGSPIQVWNPDGGYWADIEVAGMPHGTQQMDGIYVPSPFGPASEFLSHCGGWVRFVPWTLIR